jgi:hypothetical protein
MIKGQCSTVYIAGMQIVHNYFILHTGSAFDLLDSYSTEGSFLNQVCDYFSIHKHCRRLHVSIFTCLDQFYLAVEYRITTSVSHSASGAYFVPVLLNPKKVANGLIHVTSG